MVSPDSSTEGSGSGGSSMDEREKRFYSRPTSSRQPQSQSHSQSESESQSGSSDQISSKNTHKKKPAKTPTTPSRPLPSSVKRNRNEDEETTSKKTKKAKPSKEEPKKTNEDKKKGKKPEPMPSPQKSAKKPIVWNTTDEVLFLKALAAYCQDGMGFPNVMTPVYDYVRNRKTLDHEYSNSQLGDKLRRLRSKYVGMEDKVKGGGYSFKTPHEETLYKLSRKIWGREEDEEEEEEEEEEIVKETEEGKMTKKEMAIEIFGRDEEEEEEKEDEEQDVREGENKGTGEDVEMTQKENVEVNEEDGEVETNGKKNFASHGLRKHVAVKEALATPNVVSNGTISNGVQDNNDGKLIDQLVKENSVMINEFKDQVMREINEVKNDVVKMVRGLHSSVNEKMSNSVEFSIEEVVKRNSSARELPALDASEARMLEQKWQRQHLLELEVCSGHLALLQEECQKRTEKLRSLVDEDRH